MTTPATQRQVDLAAIRSAQRQWELQPIQRRLVLIGNVRSHIARHASELAATVPANMPGVLHRSIADTMAAEVLPLVEACRYLEREAASILAPRPEPRCPTPFWLGRTNVVTRRVPLGSVLIIAPGNYPLYLPGVQALQALAAGNAVLWKPAVGTSAPALAMQRILNANGIPPNLVTILDEEPDAAIEAIHAGVDKAFFTGSDKTGSAVMRELAATLTPAVMELSGCDAAFLLDGADLRRAVTAITFALRLNGSATCMAPRRLFVSNTVTHSLIAQLFTSLSAIEPIPVPLETIQRLRDLVGEAVSAGAKVLLDGFANAPDGHVGATLLSNVQPSMQIAKTDVFAPVLSIISIENEQQALAFDDECPYSLTACVFGPVRQARSFAARLRTGTVLINDMVVSTADPRAAFGGRKRSGFGVTRGREGLLEMTAVQSVITQRSRSVRPYSPLTAHHTTFFSAWLRMLHGRTLRERGAGLARLIGSARRL